jgi:ankyrin repeat protein
MFRDIQPFYYGLALLRKLPPERFFQLFVDGSMHRKEKGQEGFELREPGCMKAFYEGLLLALTHVDKSLTADSFLALVLDVHRTVSQHVSGRIGVRHPGQIRGEALKAFTVVQSRCTKQGIRDIRKREFLKNVATLKVLGSDVDLLTCTDDYLEQHLDTIYDQSDKKYLLYCPPHLSEKELSILIKRVFSSFLSKMQTATEQKNNHLKIQAIAECAKDCELIHSFEDANGRVFVNIMLDVMLMWNGFPPATFFEPNIFDLYGDSELTEAVKDAMSHTIFVIEHPDKPLFGYHAEKEDEATKPLRKLLHKRVPKSLNGALLLQHLDTLRDFLKNTWGSSLNLFRVCAVGDIDALRKADISDEQLFMRAPQSAAPLYKGKTVLHIACQMGLVDVARFLLSLNKKLVDVTDDNGNTPLHYAIEAQDEELVKLLLDHNANITIQNRSGEAALEKAAQSAGLATFLLILSKQENKINWHELFIFAASGGSHEIIRWMYVNKKISRSEACQLAKLQKNFNPLLIALDNQDAKTFQLIWRCAFGRGRVACSDMQFLFKGFRRHTSSDMLTFFFSRMTIELEDKPLLFALFEELIQTYRKNDELLEKFIDLEPDLYSVLDRGGKKISLLHLAAITGRIPIAQKLLSRQFDINRRDAAGFTPLHHAVANNRLDMMRFLCSQDGIDVNQRSNARSSYDFSKKDISISPLEMAVAREHVGAVKILLEHGAVVTDKCVASLKAGPHRDEIAAMLEGKRIEQRLKGGM